VKEAAAEVQPASPRQEALEGVSKPAAREKVPGVSTDPKARALAARQRRQAKSPNLHAPEPQTSPPFTPPPATEPKSLVRSVRVGLLKPLGDVSWDIVGARLRDMKSSMHRLLNAGVRAAAIDDGGTASLMRASRKGVKAALAGERAYWLARSGKRFEGSNHDPEKAARMSEFTLPSVVEDTVAAKAAKSFADARKHMARGDKSIPSFNRHAPIFFREGHTSWSLRRDDRGQYELGLKLGTEMRGALTWFALSVDGGSAFANLKRMVVGGEGVKLGDAKVMWNERRRGPRGERRPGWEAALVYTSPPPVRVAGDASIVVHRGMHQMLTLASTGGQVWSVPGDAYLAAKLGFAARRRKLSQHTRRGELGHGARGHGTARRYRALDSLGDAEARMIKTACQQAAARAVEFAVRECAGEILVEDYQTIQDDSEVGRRFIPKWPWAQLKAAVEWAARKAGLTVREVDSAYVSIRCPACRHISTDNVKDRMFTCGQCGLKRNTDTIAAFNALQNAGLGDVPRQKFEAALTSFARAMREEVAAK
jgi:IS605 OrfB family transposase